MTFGMGGRKRKNKEQKKKGSYRHKEVGHGSQIPIERVRDKKAFNLARRAGKAVEVMDGQKTSGGLKFTKRK